MAENLVPECRDPDYCRAMPDSVEIIEKSIRYNGFFQIVGYRFRHRLFTGGWSGEIEREVFERGHAVAVLPYDPMADAVVLIEQFRIGAMAGGLAPWQIEIVAGIIEEGETPEEVARRETMEEAGTRLGPLVPVHRYLVSPGGASESVAVYCGRADSRGLGGIHGLPHEHEDIRVSVHSFAEAMSLLNEGRITNAVTIVALQWLALNRERLRREWT
jgi:ADP-ribose pyrophosphatase